MASTYCLLVLTLITNYFFLNEAKPEYEALKIIGGDETPIGEFKYIVGINCNEVFCDCTGSIIGERFIITAAHCVQKRINHGFRFYSISPEAPSIVAGVNDVSDLQNPNRIQIDVQQLFVHSDYEEGSCVGDIAVLQLSRDLEIKKNNLQKLHLPVKSHSKFVGKQAVIVGFGASEITYQVRRDGYIDRFLKPNSKLHFANVSIVTNEQCLTNQPCIRDSNLCGQMIPNEEIAHYGVCGGDSGAPLVYRSKVLIGIHTLNNNQCNERLNYGVYQRVTSYMDFINTAMNGGVGLNSRAWGK